MSKMIIRLDDDGKVFRDDKHIATVTDGEVSFNHYSYKKHKDEIEYLVFGEYETTPDPVDVKVDPKPKTPAHLLIEGEGRWYGESNPPVVEWRKKNWSKEAFDDHYGHQLEHLQEVYGKHGLTYDRHDTNN